MFPCALQKAPWRSPAQVDALGPVKAATRPRASITANCRPCLVQPTGSGSGSRFQTESITARGDIPVRSSASACGP
jgi:hypothetical protein